MDAVGVVVGLVLLFGLAVLTLLVVGTVRTARSVAARIERHQAGARRAVENVALRARTYARPGAHGELSGVRLSVRTALEGTRQVLAAGVPQDGQLGDALRLLSQLEAHAAALDGELRVLEHEPDPGRVAVRLPELRDRAQRITHSAQSLRWAAQDRLRRFGDDELARLSAECETEAGALRHWEHDTAVDPPRQQARMSSPPGGE